MSRRSLNRYQRRRRYARYIESYLHKKMTYILSNSKAIGQELLSEGVSEHQLRVIYNGVSKLPPLARTEDAAALKEELAIEPGTTVLVIVANLIPYKGHSDLIEALSIIKNKGHSDWKLLIVGHDAANIQEVLEEKSDAFDIARHIIWLGGVSQPHRYLQIADIGVSCSHEEGFSNAILEYMAAGLAIVASAVGGTPEAIAHDETGKLYPAGDINALSSALVELLENPDKTRSLGEQAQSKMEREFSSERCISEYESLYKEILAAPKI